MKIDAVTLPNGNTLVAMHSFEDEHRALRFHEENLAQRIAEDMGTADSRVTILVSADEPIEFGETFPEVPRG